MPNDDPWNDYRNPMAGKELPPSSGDQLIGPPENPFGLDYQDIGKGIVGRFQSGVAGTLGLPGTIGSLVGAGARHVGVPENVIGAARQAAEMMPPFSALTLPDADYFRQAGKDIFGAEFYEPKTRAGKYVGTVAEFLPGAAMPGGGGVLARTINTVFPAVASEAAGQYTEGTPLEPWARGAAGVIGGVTGARMVTPTAPPTTIVRDAANVLQREGVPVTAGMSTGSRLVQGMEKIAGDMAVSSGMAQRLYERPQAAFDKAITERLFDRARLTAAGVLPEQNLPQSAVMAHGVKSLKDEYDRLANANVLRADPQLIADLRAIQTRYQSNVLPSQQAGGAQDINKIHNDIVDKLITGRGTIAGGEYQAIRSRLGSQQTSAYKTNEQLSDALRGTKVALDNAMKRGLSPEDAAAWARNDQRYSLMKQLEPAIANSTEHLAPGAVANALQAGRAGPYAMAAGPIDELARAANIMLKPLPQAGNTAARIGWHQLVPSGVGAGVGTAFGVPGMIAGAIAPHVPPLLTVTKTGQRYLGNQVAPQNARDVITQTLMQQGISQPGVIARNEAAQADIDRQIADDRRQMGLPP